MATFRWEAHEEAEVLRGTTIIFLTLMAVTFGLFLIAVGFLV